MIPVPSEKIMNELCEEFRAYVTMMFERKENRIMWQLPCTNKSGNRLAMLVQVFPCPDDNFIKEVMGMTEEKKQ